MATVLTFFAVVYVVVLDGTMNHIAVQVKIESKKAGLFAVYWPSRNGSYSEKRSSSVPYAPGKSTVEVVLRSFPGDQALRIDPLNTKGTVQLLEVTVTRFGRSFTLTPEEINARVVSTIQAGLQMTSDALLVKSDSKDPQLYLRNIPLPKPPVTSVLLFGLVFCLLLSVLCLRSLKLLQAPPAKMNIHVFIGMSAVAFFCWKSQVNELLAFIVCFLLVWSAEQVAMTLAVGWDNRVFRALLRPASVVVLFLLLIFVPFVMALGPDSGFLAVVKKEVQSIGKTTTLSQLNKKLGEKVKAIEDGFTLSFPYRDDLINLNANIKVHGLGFSPTPKAILGKNGMFFEGYGDRRVEEDVIAFFDNVTDYMGLIPFSDKELEEWRICLEERYYWLKENGIDYIFALAPSKALIYPENLPEQILETKQALARPNRYQQLVKYMHEHSPIPLVDLSKALLKAKETAEHNGTLAKTPIYYRTDFHWTYYGAYVAYRAIIDAINQWYPKYHLTATPLDHFTIKTDSHWVHYRFMYGIGLNPAANMNDTYLTFMPVADSVLAGIANFGTKGIDDGTIPQSIYKKYNGHRIATRKLENRQGSIDSIFVVGDSFSEKYYGFFSAHGRKTINFRTVYSFFPDSYLQYKPNLVIQEVLNMYLLKPPPSNPQEVQEARIRALAHQTQVALQRSVPENGGKANVE